MRVLSIKLMLAAVLMAFLPLVASADTGFYQGAIFGVGTDGGTRRVMALVWRDSRVVRVERRPPFTTRTGKVLHLHRAAR